MSITIYKDDAANAIFVEDANGVQFLNSLQAFMLDPSDTVISITDLARNIQIFSNTLYSEFVDDNAVTYGANAVEVTNALNAIFQSSGGTGNVPVITSSTSINVVNGDQVNYELLANNGVSYEWDNLPTGLSTVSGNIRKLIGSIITNGVYTPTMKAINYFGIDSETLTINVSNPTFANSKSINFVQNDYLDANASGLSGVLARASNGSGTSDAWTISLYFKSGTHTGASKQTLFYFGDTDHNNGGHIWIYYKGSEQALYFEYGSSNNFIRLKSPLSSLTVGNWSSLIFTYDGGTTGSSSGSINDYYSRFGMWIDGVSITTTNSNSNFGWSSGVDSDLFRIAKRGSGNDWLKNDCRVDEVSLWSSDQSANVASIYNMGSPHDLSSLATTPVNWWRMGDGDTFPVLTDISGSANFTMYNMTVADIVNDVP